jgi:hypothetical protein
MARRKQYITGFGGGNLEERNDLEVLHVNGKIILKWVSKKQDRGQWIGLIWLRIGTSDGLL